ncbi:MAG: hypothetical protein ACYC1I_12760 [Acidimicrobiales bacterium]
MNAQPEIGDFSFVVGIGTVDRDDSDREEMQLASALRFVKLEVHGQMALALVGPTALSAFDEDYSNIGKHLIREYLGAPIAE